MFGWHKEDLDLYSINYVHKGKPKFWYGINMSCHDKFEDLARRKFQEGFKKCSEYLRHKTTMIHPSSILSNGIKMTRAIHREGEFVVTRAKGYHAGFNSGFNIAEAVNFALPKWLKEISNFVQSC